MKRELWMALGAATLLTGAVAACSGHLHASGPSSSAAASPGPTASSNPASVSSAVASPAPAAAGETRVIIGGQPQNATGPVVCSMTNGKFSIAIGDMITGVIVGLEQDGSTVHNAGLGTVDGIVLSFTEGAPGNDATATKTGNFYKITGNAAGVDNAGQQVTKPFEVDVTCP